MKQSPLEWFKKNPTWTLIIVSALVAVVVALGLYLALKNDTNASFWVAFAALYVAIISLIYTIKTLNVSKKTLVSQKQTERNTQKVNFDKQCKLLLNLRLEILQKLAYLAALNYYVKESKTNVFPKIHKFYNLKLSETYIYEDSALDRKNSENQSENSQASPMQRIVMDDYICLCSIKEKIANYNQVIAIYYNTITDEFVHDYEKNDLLVDLRARISEIVGEVLNVNCEYEPNILMPLENSVCCLTRSALMDSVPKGNYCMEYEPLISHLFTIESEHKAKSDYFRLFQYKVFEASKTIEDWFYVNNSSK